LIFPLTVSLLSARDSYFVTLNAPYSYFAIPVYLYAIIFFVVSISLTVYGIIKVRISIVGASILTMILNLVNFLVCIETFLICLKLDNVITFRSWAPLLIPFWVLLFIGVCCGSCACFVSCVTFFEAFYQIACHSLTFLLLGCCFVWPVVLFSIFLALRLDLVVTWAWIVVFIPCLCCEVYLCCSLLSCNCIIRKTPWEKDD
jgi:hypothetical protein